MDPRARIPYGTGGETLGSLGLLDQPQREPSHLNAIAGLLDHYTMGLPAALAGLNPFGGGYAAAREAADRAKSDARQLYGGDALSLADAFGGIVPSRIPTAGADAQGLARALQSGGSKVDDALTAGVRMMPDGVGSIGGRLPSAPPARALDDLGYYSQALEAAKSWPQGKGTPEQALMWLKKSGTKDAEIEATGIARSLQGRPSVTKDEVVGLLGDNRVDLKEVQRETLESYNQKMAQREARGERVFTAEGEPDLTYTGAPRYQDFSLDPSNPTYRETVLHLPESVD